MSDRGDTKRSAASDAKGVTDEEPPLKRARVDQLIQHVAGAQIAQSGQLGAPAQRQWSLLTDLAQRNQLGMLLPFVPLREWLLLPAVSHDVQRGMKASVGTVDKPKLHTLHALEFGISDLGFFRDDAKDKDAHYTERTPFDSLLYQLGPALPSLHTLVMDAVGIVTGDVRD